MSFLFFHCVSDLFCHGIWSSFADLHDPFLKGLASELETTVIASRAPGTIDAYRRAFLRWKSFAASSAEIQAFPAKPEFVALYLQYLLDTTFSSHSVDMAVYAIQWAHSLAGLPSPTESPIVQTVKEAAKRINGAPLVHRKDPVSPDMIRQLLIRSNLHNLLELRNVCIFVLAYSGFYRKIHCLTSEFHVKFHAKNRYRTNREAMSAMSVFQVKFNLEFTSQAVNFS